MTDKKQPPAGSAYKTGYCRPPEEHRFKKGAPSPNPAGRPPGAKGMRASLRKELQLRVRVQEGGVTRMISKAELVAKRAVNRAAENGRDAMRLIEMEERLLGPEMPEDARPLDIDERALFERIKARLGGQAAGTVGEQERPMPGKGGDEGEG